MARLPLDGAQENWPARDNRIAGHWITVLMSCLRHGPWLQSCQLAICFFQESLLILSTISILIAEVSHILF